MILLYIILYIINRNNYQISCNEIFLVLEWQRQDAGSIHFERALEQILLARAYTSWVLVSEICLFSACLLFELFCLYIIRVFELGCWDLHRELGWTILFRCPLMFFGELGRKWSGFVRHVTWRQRWPWNWRLLTWLTHHNLSFNTWFWYVKKGKMLLHTSATLKLMFQYISPSYRRW